MQGKLELCLLVGAESKQWLANLTAQLDRMEKLQGAPVAATGDDEKAVKTKPKQKAKAAPVIESEESFDDFADDDLADEPANASSISDDDDFESEDIGADDDMPSDDFADDFEEEAPAPAPKKSAKASTSAPKPKKISVEDCSDAAAARAKVETKKYKGDGKKGREAVKALMKKHFNVTSVQDLTEKQYAPFIKMMSGQ